MAVERKRAVPVLDNHEVAVAGELIRERDDTFVHRTDGLRFGDIDLDAIPDDGSAESSCRLTSEARADGPARGPGQHTLKRTEGQRCAVELRDRCLQLLLRRFQFADPSRVEITALIDLGDEIAALLHGTIERGARARRLRFDRGKVLRTRL